MRKLAVIGVIFIFLTLVFCEKEEKHDWVCYFDVLTTSPGYQSVQQLDTLYYENRSHDEISAIIVKETYIGKKSQNGFEYLVVSKCSCGKLVCP